MAGSLGEIPSTGYNPARVMLDPSDPDYLKKLGLVGAVEGQHELNAPVQNVIPMRPPEPQTDDPSKQSLAQPTPEAAPPSMSGLPTLSQHDMAYQQTMDKKPAIQNLWDKTDNIQSKPARILGKIGVGVLGGAEALGESMFPTVASKIPGSVTNVAEQKEQAFTRNQQEQAAELDKEKLAATESEKEAEIQSKTELAKLNDGIRLQIASMNDATKAGDVQAMINARKQLADLTDKWHSAQLDQQYSEFKTTDQYRKIKDANDNAVKLKIAELQTNKAPAAMLGTAEFASGGLDLMQDAKTALTDLRQKGVLNSIPSNKIEDMLFGKGLVDPSLDADTRREIGQLRAALSYTSSAAMKAHTGRTSNEIYSDFKNTLGLGQEGNALDGALDETGRMLTTYSKAGSTENIENLRSGKPAAGTGAADKSASKGTVSKDMLQQYATKHKITPEAASKFLTGQGYTVGK